MKKIKIAVPLEVEVGDDVSDYDAAKSIGEQLTSDGYAVAKAGYFDSSPPAVIVDREWWYIRSAAGRGLKNTIEQLAAIKEWYKTMDEGTPLFHKNTAEGISSELIQWVRETGDHFAELNERIPRSSDKFSEELIAEARAINYGYLKGE